MCSIKYALDLWIWYTIFFTIGIPIVYGKLKSIPAWTSCIIFFFRQHSIPEYDILELIIWHISDSWGFRCNTYQLLYLTLTSNCLYIWHHSLLFCLASKRAWFWVIINQKWSFITPFPEPYEDDECSGKWERKNEGVVTQYWF